MIKERGDWIQTYTGKKFYPLDPRPEDVCIEDIAHALSLICRYNGHSRVFYSVAEHSYRMSLAEIRGNPKWFLMHDAAEAFLSDVPRPIKPMLPEFAQIEKSILKVIGEKFNLGEFDEAEILNADLIMLATEKRDVLVFNHINWNVKLPQPLEDIICPIHPRITESLFLLRARTLGII